jgi:hypothetical protein
MRRVMGHNGNMKTRNKSRSQNSKGPNKPWEAKLFEKRGDIAATVFVALLVELAKDPKLPWSGAILVGAALLSLLALYRLWGIRPFAIKGRLFLFLLSYIALFCMIGNWRLLSWGRVLAGYEETAPGNWLGLSRFGDWHYWFARQVAPRQDFLVVFLPPIGGKTLEEARFQLVSLIDTAVLNGARGVAFDFYLEHESALDSLVCDKIEAAWTQKRPVAIFAGYRHRVDRGRVERVPVAKTLARCLSDDRIGHLAVFLESDGRVRTAPLHLGKIAGLVSLDYRIAEFMADGKLRLPENDLVQFVEPRPEVLSASYEELAGNGDLVRDRFLLVGRENKNDSFLTPFGRRPGVMVHADVVEALRDGRMVQRAPWWLEEVLIAASCYLLTTLIVRRVRMFRVVQIAAGLTVGTLLIAALAMRFLVWLDVCYPVMAAWLILVVLWAMKMRAGSAPAVLSGRRPAHRVHQCSAVQ